MTIDDDGVLPGAPGHQPDSTFEGIDHELRAIIALQPTVQGGTKVHHRPPVVTYPQR